MVIITLWLASDYKTSRVKRGDKVPDGDWSAAGGNGLKTRECDVRGLNMLRQNRFEKYSEYCVLTLDNVHHRLLCHNWTNCEVEKCEKEIRK